MIEERLLGRRFLWIYSQPEPIMVRVEKVIFDMNGYVMWLIDDFGAIYPWDKIWRVTEEEENPSYGSDR